MVAWPWYRCTRRRGLDCGRSWRSSALFDRRRCVSYTVASSNVNVLTGPQTGTTFRATGIAAGMAAITIHDANSTAVNIIATVQ